LLWPDTWFEERHLGRYLSFSTTEGLQNEHSSVPGAFAILRGIATRRWAIGGGAATRKERESREDNG
jgi:hypothetical protein